MTEVCKTCKNSKTLVMFDYSNGGCDHADYDGWVCTVFEDDGNVIYMVGVEDDTAHCEMWTRKFSIVKTGEDEQNDD